MRIRVVVAVALLLVSAGACSSKDSSKHSGPTTTVEPINPTTTLAPTTTAAGKTTKTTAPATKATTAEAASNRLFDAWKAGNKTAAKQVANDAAVNELFSHPYTGPSPTFQGCEPDGATFICSYTYEGGAMQFTVSGSAAAGFTVTKVGYIAD